MKRDFWEKKSKNVRLGSSEMGEIKESSPPIDQGAEGKEWGVSGRLAPTSEKKVKCRGNCRSFKLAWLNTVGKNKCGETPSVPTRKCNSVWPLPVHSCAPRQSTNLQMGALEIKAAEVSLPRGVHSPPTLFRYGKTIQKRKQLAIWKQDGKPAGPEPRQPSLALPKLCLLLGHLRYPVVLSNRSAMKTN